MAYINKDVSTMAMPSGMNRMGQFPLDMSSVFYNEAELRTYATSGAIAYVGQIVSLVDETNKKVTVYSIQNTDGLLKEVGTVPVGASNGAISVSAEGAISVLVDGTTIKIVDNKLVASLPECDGKSIESIDDKISMHDFGVAYYEYIPEVKDEEGNVTKEASYAKVTVSESKPWKAGLEPKVVTEEGKLVIGWFEPNPTTIEGVNDQVTAVQGTVADLEQSVGAPSAEGQAATGLYKEVEDVQGEVKELADEVGSSEDSLNEETKTLWAHVNDHEGRIDTLEGQVENHAGRIEALEGKEDKDTKYHLEYSSEKKEIQLVTGEGTMTIDATPFIKDGMLDSVDYNADTNTLTFTFNTDAGKEAVDVELTDILAPYTGSTGERIDVAVSGNAISADLKTGTITKDYLHADVQASLDKADSALQSHQDISHLAVKTDVESEFAKYTTTANLTTLLEGKQDVIPENTYDAYGAAATAKSEAISDAASKYYGKGETYTKTEIDELLDGIQGGASESAASVNTKLEAYKKVVNAEVWGDEAGAGVDGNSRIDLAENRLTALENVGAQANVIEEVKGATDNRLSVSTSGKVVTIDDANLRSDIAAAKKAGDDAGVAAGTAQNTADVAKGKAEANAEAITALQQADTTANGKIQALETAVNNEESGLAATHAKAVQNAADVATLVAKDKTHDEDISGLKTATSNNGTAITNLQTAVSNVYTKTEADGKYATKAEVGTPTSGKTIVQMIAEAQAAATYDDTKVKEDIQKNATAIENITKEGGAIATAVKAEADIARAAEKELADDIAEINALLNTVSSEDQITSLKELAIWVEEHGGEASKMAESIKANADAIELINDEEKGILVQAKAHSDANLATAKAYADAEIAKIHGVDNKTIKLAENKAYVAEVSTDILVQGAQELVLCGGNASGFATV